MSKYASADHFLAPFVFILMLASFILRMQIKYFADFGVSAFHKRQCAMVFVVGTLSDKLATRTFVFKR
jgi:hypothetical protein